MWVWRLQCGQLRERSRGGLGLYSDALIERRAQMIDEGMEDLAHAVAARRDKPSAALVSALLRELRDAEHPDDVCLLVAGV